MTGMATKIPTIRAMSPRMKTKIVSRIHKNNFIECPFVAFQLDFNALSKLKFWSTIYPGTNSSLQQMWIPGIINRTNPTIVTIIVIILAII